MKVLHVVAKLAEGGGIAETVLGLTRSLLSSNVQVCGILTLAESGLAPFMERCTAKGIQVHTVTPGWCHTLWFSRDWIKQLRQIAPNYDLIHIHGLWLYPQLATARWSARNKVPFVLSPHGSLLPAALAQSGWKKRLLSPWVWRVYRRAACVHVTSEAEAQVVRNFWGEQALSIVRLPDGVEPCEGLSPCSQSQLSVRYVTYLGRVSPEKNLDMLMDAWAQIPPERRRGWCLRLIGFPPKGVSRYADAWVRKYANMPDVLLEKYCSVDEKWQALAASDVVVLPSISENFGIVVAEALACGVPVITTKGAPWEELETSQCGWWVDIGVEPLAEALLESMSLTDEERHVMGETGSRLVKAKYLWPKIAEGMAAAYKLAIGRQ